MPSHRYRRNRSEFEAAVGALRADKQCFECTHYRIGGTCAAFADGIPNELFFGTFDHRYPHPDDAGLRFAPCTPIAEDTRPFE